MPLWPLWERYFATCPGGSALPLVHTQDVSSSGRAQLQRALDIYGGAIVPVWRTVLGYPRFNFKMNKMMLRLYGLAAQSVAQNGCPPSYVHMLSERDVPVRTCAETHRFLESTAGASHMVWTDDPIHEAPYVSGRRPPSMDVFTSRFRPFGRTSQWMTLWTDHAAALAADEVSLERKWTPHQDIEGANVWNDGNDGHR